MFGNEAGFAKVVGPGLERMLLKKKMKNIIVGSFLNIPWLEKDEELPKKFVGEAALPSPN